ncbi:hypothetical protein ACJJTC_000630 [Scirpophaga incertulas]
MSRKNYTEREKRELLRIVDKYKIIIENKSTNAVTVEKKNDTWETIAREYNSSAENPRTARQLNTAYQNLKRLTRQKTAEDNKQNYMEVKLKNDLKKYKKEQAEDKKAIMTTGGGTFTPQLTEVGAQMLALMGDQLTPLSNNCDSATEYFRKDDGNNNVTIEIIQELEESTTAPEDLSIDEAPPILPPPPASKPKKKIVLNNGKKKIKINNTIALKRKYYKTKLETALLEKKIQLVNYNISIQKQKLVALELKIKEAEYKMLIDR